MKKMILLALILIAGAATMQVSAQKRGNSIVCFTSSMDCSNCEKTLLDYLRFEKGVKGLKVDHVSNTIYIEYKSSKNTDEAMGKSIEKKGYLAEKITIDEYKNILQKAQEDDHEHGMEVHKER